MKNFSQRAITMAASVSDGLPPVHIEDFKQINKESFGLILSSIDTRKDYSHNEYHEAIASLTDNKLGIVPGSLYRIDSYTKTPVFRCVAASNREILPYDEADMKKRGMHTTVANLLEDSNGHIWRIVSNGDSKHVVQVTEENYEDILANRRRRALMTASHDDSTAVDFKDADYLYFFNPKLEAMDFGFAIKSGDKAHAYSRTLKEAIAISPYQVIEAASTDGYNLGITNKRRELTAARSGGMSEYIAYLRELYGKASEYVKLWEKVIRNSPSLVK